MGEIPKTLYDIQITINGNLVGRAEGLTFTRAQNLSHKHEAGTKHPYAIQRLGIEPTGSLIRAWADNDLIKDLVNFETGNNREFTLIGKAVGSDVSYVVEGAVIGTMGLSFSFDNTEENYEFYALKIYPEGANLG